LRFTGYLNTDGVRCNLLFERPATELARLADDAAAEAEGKVVETAKALEQQAASALYRGFPDDWGQLLLSNPSHWIAEVHSLVEMAAKKEKKKLVDDNADNVLGTVVLSSLTSIEKDLQADETLLEALVSKKDCALAIQELEEELATLPREFSVPNRAL